MFGPVTISVVDLLFRHVKRARSHVTGRHSTQQSRVYHARDDVASDRGLIRLYFMRMTQRILEDSLAVL